MIRVMTLLAVPALFAIPAAAQEQVEDPYAPCAELADDGERLACFDATHAAQRVILAEAAERAEALVEETFGMRDRDEDIEREDIEITATVVEVFTDGSRRPVLRLDNGQFWRETSGSTLRNRVRDGWTATITRHWSGVYEMRFEGRTGYLRVNRLQ